MTHLEPVTCFMGRDRVDIESLILLTHTRKRLTVNMEGFFLVKDCPGTGNRAILIYIATSRRVIVLKICNCGILRIVNISLGNKRSAMLRPRRISAIRNLLETEVETTFIPGCRPVRNSLCLSTCEPVTTRLVWLYPVTNSMGPWKIPLAQ